MLPMGRPRKGHRDPKVTYSHPYRFGDVLGRFKCLTTGFYFRDSSLSACRNRSEHLPMPTNRRGEPRMSVLAHVRTSGAAITYVDGKLDITGQGVAKYHDIAVLDSQDALTWASPESCEWFYSPAVQEHFTPREPTPVRSRRSVGPPSRPRKHRLTMIVLFVGVALIAVWVVQVAQQFPGQSSSGEVISTPYMDRPAVASSADGYRASVSTVRGHLSAGLRVVRAGLSSNNDGQVRDGLDAVAACYAEAGTLAPPPSMGTQHENLMQALNGYQQWARTMRLATQASRPSEREQLMGAAMPMLRQSTSDMDSALVSIGLS